MVTLVLIGIFTSLYQIQSTQAATAYLHSSGTKILSSTGNDMTLTGVFYGVYSPLISDYWGGANAITNTSFTRISLNGGNMMRINMISWGDLETAKGVYDSTTFAQLDTLATWAQQNQVYLILSMAELCYSGYTIPAWVSPTGVSVSTFEAGFYDKTNSAYDSARTDYIECMVYMADRYASNPYVLLEPFNEPFQGNTLLSGWSTSQKTTVSANYASTMEDIVDAMAAAGYSNPVVIPMPWVNYYGITSSDVDRTNIIWDHHPYLVEGDSVATYESNINGIISMVNGWGKPIILGEWGYVDSGYIATDTIANWQSTLTTLYSYLRSTALNGYLWYASSMLYGEQAQYVWNSGTAYISETNSNWVLSNMMVGGTVPGSVASITDTIGGNSDGGNYLNSGNFRVFPINASSNGTLSTLGLNVGNASGHIRLALYSNCNNTALTGLLAQTDSVTAVAGWNDLPITSGAANITSGTTYYIAVQADTTDLDYYMIWEGLEYYGNMGGGVYAAFSSPMTIEGNETYVTINMRMTYTSNAVYALAATINTPANSTYTSATVPYNVTVSGNETNPLYQINVYKAGVAVGANVTTSTGLFTGLTNGSYTLAASVVGDHGASDYETVMFTVAIPATPTYTITVTSTYGNPTASASVTAGQSYATSVTSPYSLSSGVRYVCTGYSIDNAGAGVQYSGVSYTFTNIQANHQIWYYWKAQYYLTVSSIYGTTSGAGWYDAKTNATFSVSSSTVSGGTGTQYVLSGWAGSGTNSYTGSSASYQVNMTNAISETANWVTQYYLNVTSPYATTSGSGWYNSGATAYAGLDSYYEYTGGINYTFSGWSSGGSNYTQSDPIIMSTSLTVVAYWIPGTNQYIIYASAGTGGSISPSGSVPVQSGYNQTFTITPNDGYSVGQVVVNDENKGALLTYTFYNVTATQTITVYFLPTYTSTTAKNMTLYFRSDSYTYQDITGYKLAEDYTNDYATIAVTPGTLSNITYGFRVYIVSDSIHKTELSSTEIARIYLSSNFSGQISSSWICPETTISLGLQAFEVDLYVSTDDGATWTNQGTFISSALMTKQVYGTQWTFTLNVNATFTTATTSNVYFGDAVYRSAISGIQYLSPKASEIGQFRLFSGDLVGFTFGSYFDIMGSGFYALVLFGVCGSLYRRYQHAGVIVVFFVLFGGTGGLIIGFLPIWAATVTAIIMILSCAVLLWRIIR